MDLESLLAKAKALPDIDLEKGDLSEEQVELIQMATKLLKAGGVDMGIKLEKKAPVESPEVIAARKESERVIADALTKAAIMEDRLKKMETEALRKDTIGRISPLIKHIPDTVENIADLLLKMDNDTRGKVEAILKAVDTIIAKSATFKEVGYERTETNTGAWGRIQAEAKTIMAKSTNMTEAQAISIVMQQNPSLVQEYQNERFGKRN